MKTNDNIDYWNLALELCLPIIVAGTIVCLGVVLVSQNISHAEKPILLVLVVTQSTAMIGAVKGYLNGRAANKIHSLVNSEYQRTQMKVDHLEDMLNKSNVEMRAEISKNTVREDLVATLLSYSDVIADMETGRVYLATDSFERLFGYAEGSLIGQEVEIFIPPDRRAQHLEYRKQFALDPTSRDIGLRGPLKAWHHNGYTIDVNVGLRPGIIAGHKCVIVSVLRNKIAGELNITPQSAKQEGQGGEGSITPLPPESKPN